MKVYLCSRIAKDAHAVNNVVAETLRDAGHDVFVPHEQHYNQIMAGTDDQVPDSEIYEQDFAAMKTSRICVVVGRVGVDCAWEIGWFSANGVRVLWFDPPVTRHPMLSGPQVYKVSTLFEMMAFVAGVGK